LKNFNKVLHMI